MSNRRLVDENPQDVLMAGRRSFFRSIHFLPVLVGVLVLLNVLLFQRILFSSQGIPGFRNQCALVEELETKVRHLKEDNQRLFNKIQAFKNSPRAQEKMVREGLGWVRENELLIEFQQKQPNPLQ
jgi:cell division protein FtsB